MVIVLGDSRPIVVHNQEIYDSPYAFAMRLEHLQLQGYTLLNPADGPAPSRSFWILSYRSAHYILLDRPSAPVLLGRSSDCHLLVPEPAISRRHASLHFEGGEWAVWDGDGAQASSNGVWVKTRRMWVGWEGREAGEERCKEGEERCKVGDILLSFAIREEHSLVHIEECVSFNRSTDGSLQETKRELEDSPGLEKHRSQL